MARVMKGVMNLPRDKEVKHTSWLSSPHRKLKKAKNNKKHNTNKGTKLGNLTGSEAHRVVTWKVHRAHEIARQINAEIEATQKRHG